MTPQIIRTREELAALDPDTLLAERRDAWGDTVLTADDWMSDWNDDADGNIVVVATGEQVRAARQALEADDDLWNLPSHRTEAGYPNCSTCDGGGCPDCTDPA